MRQRHRAHVESWDAAAVPRLPASGRCARTACARTPVSRARIRAGPRWTVAFGRFCFRTGADDCGRTRVQVVCQRRRSARAHASRGIWPRRRGSAVQCGQTLLTVARARGWPRNRWIFPRSLFVGPRGLRVQPDERGGRGGRPAQSNPRHRRTRADRASADRFIDSRWRKCVGVLRRQRPRIFAAVLPPD